MKYALVTGVSRGLGAAFVRYLSEEGFTVFAGVKGLNPTVSQDPNIKYIQLDVADDNSIDRAFKEISLLTNSLQLLINNAAINKDTATNGNPNDASKIENIKRDTLLNMFNVNAISPLMVTQRFLPLLVESPSFIINISSCRASFHDEFINDNPNYGYAGSKIALNMFTYGLSKELPKNIRTFAVHPGDMKTEMNPDGSQDPYNQAENIMNIIENWNDSMNGKFLRWSGEKYPL